VAVVIDDQAAGNIAYRIAAKCHHSMRKNEPPHTLSCFVHITNDETSIHHTLCSCTIGNSGCCGHIIGLLFQLAEYHTLQLSSVPDPVPSTSLPQEWHKPRGDRIGPVRIEDIQLAAPTALGMHSRAVCSTLYNPIAGCTPPDFGSLRSQLELLSPDSQWLTLENSSDQVVETKLGTFSKGSVLSYQQTQDPTNITNVNNIDFPDLPLNNHMLPLSEQPLADEEMTKLQQLVVSSEQSVKFEKETRPQSECAQWFALRQTRLTASKVGMICKRRKDHEKLCDQLRRKFHATRVMKEGTIREPHAAVVYAGIMNNSVNLYPCGLVISPYAFWIAASPDRKVYNPDRQPPYGLLEIKCPQNEHIADIKYLTAESTPTGPMHRLKTSDNYYYQIMCQLAVTGLTWCDFFIYLASDEYHLETIYFDQDFWKEAQAKVDTFFFSYFLMSVSN